MPQAPRRRASDRPPSRTGCPRRCATRKRIRALASPFFGASSYVDGGAPRTSPSSLQCRRCRAVRPRGSGEVADATARGRTMRSPRSPHRHARQASTSPSRVRRRPRAHRRTGRHGSRRETSTDLRKRGLDAEVSAPVVVDGVFRRRWDRSRTCARGADVERSTPQACRTSGATSVPASEDACEHQRRDDRRSPQPYFSISLPRRGTACSTFFFAEPRSLSYALFATPLFALEAFASVIESRASATRSVFDGRSRRQACLRTSRRRKSDRVPRRTREACPRPPFDEPRLIPSRAVAGLDGEAGDPTLSFTSVA